ncbi:hypothetical protein AB0O57_19520 [Streptomyces sp. NPDC091201]|uniref:hypothetical protein n=1 Tax=Streptomyces sp. NPDC091201 TaxID=3155190 RepID=UPI00341E6DA3
MIRQAAPPPERETADAPADDGVSTDAVAAGPDPTRSQAQALVLLLAARGGQPRQ